MGRYATQDAHIYSSQSAPTPPRHARGGGACRCGLGRARCPGFCASQASTGWRCKLGRSSSGRAAGVVDLHPRRHGARAGAGLVDRASHHLDQLAQVEQVEQLGQQVMTPLRRMASARPSAGVLPAVNLADFSPALRTQLLVLQATPFCNIDCSYCYLPDRNNKARMPMATLRAAVQRLLDDDLLADELTVVWHAGEPLVLPPAYYEEALALIAKAMPAGVLLTHAMQTNATLIDDAWCEFFLRHCVAVGVSVDGPAALHDLHRRTRKGAGTHGQVLRGLQALRRHGVAHHAIAVVTSAALSDPDGFYAWFEDQGITELGCNFDEAEGVHTQSSLMGHDAAHAAFLQRLLQLSLRGRVVVRELASAWRSVATPLPRWQWAGHDWPHNTQVMPLALLTVGVGGDFSTFSPELLGQRWPAFDDFVLGNVLRDGLKASLSREPFARLWAAISAGVLACEKQCVYFDYCGGGAPANKLYERGDFKVTETLHCRSMLQRPFDAVLQQAEFEQGLQA
jgi:uncharacterized protein